MSCFEEDRGCQPPATCVTLGGTDYDVVKARWAVGKRTWITGYISPSATKFSFEVHDDMMEVLSWCRVGKKLFE